MWDAMSAFARIAETVLISSDCKSAKARQVCASELYASDCEFTIWLYVDIWYIVRRNNIVLIKAIPKLPPSWRMMLNNPEGLSDLCLGTFEGQPWSGVNINPIANPRMYSASIIWWCSEYITRAVNKQAKCQKNYANARRDSRIDSIDRILISAHDCWIIPTGRNSEPAWNAVYPRKLKIWAEVKTYCEHAESKYEQNFRLQR